MRNVIVTGGSRGLGLAIAKQLVAEGYSVVAIARRESKPLLDEIARASARHRRAGVSPI